MRHWVLLHLLIANESSAGGLQDLARLGGRGLGTLPRFVLSIGSSSEERNASSRNGLNLVLHRRPAADLRHFDYRRRPLRTLQSARASRGPRGASCRHLVGCAPADSGDFLFGEILSRPRLVLSPGHAGFHLIINGYSDLQLGVYFNWSKRFECPPLAILTASPRCGF